MTKYIPFKFPLLNNIFCVFTTKWAGDVLRPDVKERIKNDLMLSDILELNQKHKDNIVFCDSISKDIEADAVATSLTNVGLMIKTADCQPLLLTHSSQKYIAAFHVGWRANRGGFLYKWIKKFCERYRIDAQDLFVVRGPSLSSYAAWFVNFDKEWGDEFKKYYDPKQKTVNLWRLTKDQLIECGIKKQNIFELDLCTYYCEFFFSYRRERSSERQASIIWIRPCS